MVRITSKCQKGFFTYLANYLSPYWDRPGEYRGGGDYPRPIGYDSRPNWDYRNGRPWGHDDRPWNNWQGRDYGRDLLSSCWSLLLMISKAGEMVRLRTITGQAPDGLLQLNGFPTRSTLPTFPPFPSPLPTFHTFQSLPSKDRHLQLRLKAALRLLPLSTPIR